MMTNAQRLERLLRDGLLPELEDYMDEMFDLIASKKATEEDKEGLQEARELRAEYLAILKELEMEELDEEECLGIIEELEEMRTEDGEE